MSKVISSRPVDNVVAIYLKQKELDVLYRVQTGAFAVYSNAEKMRDQIRSLNDDISAGYKNAYIRQVNNLFKVQVGAFRVRENAERVVANLKLKGINSFITTV